MVEMSYDYITNTYEWLNSIYMNSPQGVIIMLPHNVVSGNDLECKLKRYIWLV